MNKLILDKEKNISLNIAIDTVCNISKEYSINNLNIVLANNVRFIINHYSEVIENDLKINVKQLDNSEFIYNHSFKNNKKYNLYVNVDMVGNKSINKINIHGINDSGTSIIKIDGSVNEFTKDNEIYENIKMLNINDGMSSIYPNMFIDTKNVVANHAASVSNINKDYLFYLSSKGLNIDSSKKLIIDGFLDNIAR